MPTKCGNQQDNMKVFPMGLYFVYKPLPPFDDFAACIKKEIWSSKMSGYEVLIIPIFP